MNNENNSKDFIIITALLLTFSIMTTNYLNKQETEKLEKRVKALEIIVDKNL